MLAAERSPQERPIQKITSDPVSFSANPLMLHQIIQVSRWLLPNIYIHKPDGFFVEVNALHSGLCRYFLNWLRVFQCLCVRVSVYVCSFLPTSVYYTLCKHTFWLEKKEWRNVINRAFILKEHGTLSQIHSQLEIREGFFCFFHSLGILCFSIKFPTWNISRNYQLCVEAHVL